MKAICLKIKNIGKLEDVTVPIDKPLILLYGEVRQGKSTVLNCVRWVFGGQFPQDIIRHGAKEGSIEFQLDGGMIARSFYRAKDGTINARPVVFVRNGKPVSSPVTEIKRFLNPFLLDQDFLRNKTELERKQYFTELFAVDTTELDTELFNSQRDAQSLRAKISGYGEIDLTPVEPVDASQLKQTLADIRTKLETDRATVREKNIGIQNHNNLVSNRTAKRGELADEVQSIKRQLKQVEEELAEHISWLNQNQRQAMLHDPTVPDTTDLEKKIQDAGATNVRAENYKAAKARAEAKKADEKQLSAMEKRQRDIKAEKQAKLKSIGDSCGIDGLEFDDAGNFIYQGTTAGMISDSQIMTLSCELSKLYPAGFDLSLIDRAESLGKSIFEFVDRAKAEKKTIMATIVGERPAKVPPEIGVFVVEDGRVQ